MTPLLTKEGEGGDLNRAGSRLLEVIENST